MIRVFLVYRQNDVANFQKVLEESGGIFCAAVQVPFRNNQGQVVGLQFAILYDHTEELSMEVLT